MSTVMLDGDEVVVQPFSGFKAAVATIVAKDAASVYPTMRKALAEFHAEYRRDHSLRVDRATAEYRLGDRARAISEEAWKASSNELEAQTAAPARGEEIANVYFPLGVEHAWPALTKVMALVTIPNRRLEELDEEGGSDRVFDYLKEEARKIQHKPLDELLELAVVAAETLEDQLAGKVRELGPRLGGIKRLFGVPTEEAPLETEPESSTNGSAPSSSASPEASEAEAGTTPASSTAPAGPSSSTSDDER